VNLDHLCIGTNYCNTRDKVDKGRGVTQVYRGEQHPNAKLTDEQAAEIRARALSGERTQNLAREFGINDSAVSLIKHRRTYQHV
jgi:hypothetical protein